MVTPATEWDSGRADTRVVASTIGAALPFLVLLAGACALSGACYCGDRRRDLRPDYRLAGAAASHLLFCHHNARLRHHRHPGGIGVAERHRRWCGRSWACLSETFRLAVGLLLLL